MPVSYHGTSRANAESMIGQPNQGNISVARGGGELGRGFYTQDHKTNAMRWATARNRLPAVLTINIQNAAYNNLRIKEISTSRSRSLNQSLRANQTTMTYTNVYDVIEACLINDQSIKQFKFQSNNAQQVLNGQQTSRTLA